MKVDCSALMSAIAACSRADAPDRQLDASIALAVFPSLAEWPMLEAGVWSHGDGTRIRALRYSAARSAASTLVPAGYWIETNDGKVCVCGAEGEWDGSHSIEAIAICIAALKARLEIQLEA